MNALTARLGKLLSPEETETFVRSMRHSVAVGSRENIIRDGDEVSGLRILTEGIACRARSMPGGRRAIVGYLLPGDFCDLNAVITGRRNHGVISVTPCRVSEIPLQAFADLSTRPGILRALLWSSVQEEAILREWLANMGQETADHRVAHLLCELRMRLEAIGMSRAGELNLAITQEELGECLGISTVHVNRVMQRLRGDDLIRLKGRMIVIPDIKRLETFAAFDAGYLTPLDPGRVFRNMTAYRMSAE
jgi:CRP-like cAMP-binding protein